MPDDVDPVEWGYERVKQDLRESLSGIGVEFDTWFSERSLVESGAIEATLADLRSHGVVFEEDGATWLRTTDFGDDKDRVLVTSDGEPTYLLPDIRSEEHTSEIQSLMRISYAVFCLKKKHNH